MKLFIFIFLPLFSTLCWAQSVVFNEAMSSNLTALADEDGEYPDWLELYNNNNYAVNLGGYFISDNKENLKKWIFPESYIAGNGHMLLFASGKDRRFSLADAKHWETIIRPGDIWKYFGNNKEPYEQWIALDFDDSLWQSDQAGFGFGDDDDSTIVDHTTALFIRKSFFIEDVSKVLNMVFHVDFDDGFVAYLNGIEIARSNIGIVNVRPDYNQLADSNREAEIYRGGLPEIFVVENFREIIENGNNVLAIEVHNGSATSSDLSIIPYLTMGFSESPAEARGFSLELAETFGLLHTNFKIAANGETLFLSGIDSIIIDSLLVPSLKPDISYGRTNDGDSAWVYFNLGTPGISNNDLEGLPDYTENVDVQPLAGFYTSTVEVVLFVSDSTTRIYYSLDGSEPTEESFYYSQPFLLDSTSVIRTRAFADGKLNSDIATVTYIINETISLPVISLTTDPDNLWDWNNGIYVNGPNWTSDYPHYGANYWMDWEKPVHMEFFETDGSLAIRQDCGLKLFGGYSRVWPQKAMSLFARASYGKNSFDHKIFSDREIESFSSFILRGSGSEWAMTMIRDAMMQSLIYDYTDVDIMAYRPAVLFLNGQYWGILNIREKMNEDYLENHHNVDPDNVDILEGNGSVVEGGADHYEAMINFIQNVDLSIQENYNFLSTQMDINNFIDYQIAEIYFGNTDWPGNNIKFWRPKTVTGKWRWLMFDTDFGFGYFGNAQYYDDHLFAAMQTNGSSWPNPPWSTYLLRRLMTNEKFKEKFILRFADHLNITFYPNRVEDIITHMKSVLEPDMQRNIDRWKDEPADFNRSFGSYSQWQDSYTILYEFAQNRPASVRQHIQKMFDLSGNSRLIVQTLPLEGGAVLVNNFPVAESATWSGRFFNDMPINLKAAPAPGYKFIRWENAVDTTKSEISIEFSENIKIVANFELAQIDTSKIVINEINYNSSSEFDVEDWVEIYNNNEAAIDVSSWKVNNVNDDNTYVLPENTFLGPLEYLVVARDSETFLEKFPTVNNVVGPSIYPYLNSGDGVRLYADNNKLVDSVYYDDNFPWPESADGAGYTLELIDPESDNTVAENWSASKILYGTPGRNNGDPLDIQKDRSGIIAYSWTLKQNYPNPFNPDTIIEYVIPVPGNVNLSVYNITGQKVNTLVNEFHSRGKYKVMFKAGNLASGIYFYKLKAHDFEMVNKMILIR